MKKKIRDFKAVESDASKEPVETLYGEKGRFHERGNSWKNRNNSWKDRNNKFRSKSRSDSERRYRYESSRRKSLRDRHPSFRSFSRGKEETRDRTLKRTFNCETFVMDTDKSIVEQEVENEGVIDTGCPVMVAGEAWVRTFENGANKKFKFGDEIAEAQSNKNKQLK